MRYLSVVLLAALVTSGCYMGMGRCPDTEDLPTFTVDEGVYAQNAESTVYSGNPDLEAMRDASITVDRQANTAALTFVTDDGRTVKIDYRIDSASFELQ